MKNTFFLITSLLLASLLGGCVAPNTHFGAWENNYTKNENTIDESITFKHAFSYAMPVREKRYFDKTILNADFKDDAWERIVRQEGFNAVALSGTSSDISGGLGLGLSVIDSYLARQSLSEKFTSAYLVVDGSGDAVAIKEASFQKAVKQTKDAIKHMAKEFDYDVQCVSHCEEVSSVYKLTKTKLLNDPLVYEPATLYVLMYLSDFEYVNKDTATHKLLATKDSPNVITAKSWAVRIIAPPKSGYNPQELAIPLYVHHGMKTITSMRKHYLDRTVLGRNMLRVIAKEIPFWVSYSNNGFKNYGIYQGQMYWIDDMTKADTLKGYPITN